jgi:hypothetical protein
MELREREGLMIMPPGMDLPGKRFAEKILETSEACGRRMAQDPVVLAASRNELDGEQWFKLLARFWGIKRFCYFIYASWGKTNIWGLNGEYLEADHFVAKQLYDESMQEATLAELMVAKGWVESEEALYAHPFARLTDHAARYIFWLRGLSKFSCPTRFAGASLSSKVLEHFWMAEMAKAARDPDIPKVFCVYRSEAHVQMGKVILAKYARGSLMEGECVWAANCALDLYLNTLAELATFVGVRDVALARSEGNR